MPLYEYQCEACGQRFELIQKFSDPLADTCPKCGKGPVQKLLSSPAIQFKGTGWYITDYAQKGKSNGSAAAGKGDKADTGATGDKSDAGTSSGTASPSTSDSSASSSSSSSSPSTSGSSDKK